MILKHLFLQYNTNKGPTYGSRFMKFCGELVLGTPAQKGLGHLRKDLQDTYYYIKEDRHIPMKAIQPWQIQSILVAQYRDLEAPQVARATFFGLLPVIFLCVALAAPFNGSLKAAFEAGTAGKTGTYISGLFGSDEKWTLDKCVALGKRLDAGEITREQVPNFEAVKAECQTLAKSN